jgi:hypothetical protein
MCAALVAAGVVLAGAVPGVPVTPAHADDGDGLWYVNLPGVQQAHAAGITGKGIKIADIDSQINLDAPFLKGVSNIVVPKHSFCKDPQSGEWQPATGSNYDATNHATDMVGYLKGSGKGAVVGQAPVGVVPDATVYVYPIGKGMYFSPSFSACSNQADVVASAIRAAIAQHVDVIAMPIGGPAHANDVAALLEAQRAGIAVFIGHNNDMTTVSSALASGEVATGTGYVEEMTGASYSSYVPGLVTVQAVGADGALQVASAVADPGIDLTAPGVGVTMESDRLRINGESDDEVWRSYTSSASAGTSGATVISAGYYALAKQKWPKATTNQLLQLVARTTPANVSKLSPHRDAQKYLGWGFISVKNMLATNPARFPDVNPALQSDVTSQPSLYQSGAGKKFADLLHAQESVKASPSAAAAGTSAGGVPAWVIGGGALVVLCGVGVVLFVLLRRRRRDQVPHTDEALSGSASPQISSSWPQPGTFPRDPGPIPPRPPRPSEKN